MTPIKININNPEELKKFKKETSGFSSSYGFPYKLDDLTDKGANYTIFCPIRWKQAYPPAKLRKLLKEDVDADRIKVEYIDIRYLTHLKSLYQTYQNYMSWSAESQRLQCDIFNSTNKTERIWSYHRLTKSHQ